VPGTGDDLGGRDVGGYGDVGEDGGKGADKLDAGNVGGGGVGADDAPVDGWALWFS
jgi:hypothetical protein